MTCRICGADTKQVLDLGASPPANSLKNSPADPQESFPLVLEWCDVCDNVQLRDTLSADELYRDYLYVTPSSQLLSSHYDSLYAFLASSDYVSSRSFVVEAGSNVGNFLAHIQPHVRRVLGVDPANRICEMANEAGVPTICDFFDRRRVKKILVENGHADLVVARHCVAHNPSPHEMIAAAGELVSDAGYVAIENAYVVNTIENGEFDQIYHEHMFYFSIKSMRALLRQHGMRIVDTAMSPVHGGSVIFVAAKGVDGPVSPSVERYEARERLVLNAHSFVRFSERASEVRMRLRKLIDDLARRGFRIYTYGATAKGNTLLNFTGLSNEQIPYCVDGTPLKQGRFLPMSNIEIISEEQAASEPPDYFLLTAWNYESEIVAKVRAAGNHRTRFIVPIPSVRMT